MRKDISKQLKKLNREILKGRLSREQLRRKHRNQPIQKSDIVDLIIALNSSDSFDELYELIDMM